MLRIAFRVRLLWALFLALPTVALWGADPAPGLVWDSGRKDYVAHRGETSAVLTFHVKNTSRYSEKITRVETSCGCTVAKIPREPWVLMPGEEGDLLATVDLRGKTGILSKYVYVKMPGKTTSLGVVIHLPTAESPSNIEAATR